VVLRLPLRKERLPCLSFELVEGLPALLWLILEVRCFGEPTAKVEKVDCLCLTGDVLGVGWCCVHGS
jgi:hypothetical protein